MDSVGIAFELMRIEIEAEVENLNSDGAEKFRESQYDLAETLIKKGKALKSFSEKVRQLEEEWSASFAAQTSTPDEPKLAITKRKILSGTKASKTGLLVRFSCGAVISEKTAADTLVKFIQKVGAQKVADLKILVNNENIVSTTASPNGYGEKFVSPHYIKTHSNTAQKRRNIEDISRALGISCEVIII